MPTLPPPQTIQNPIVPVNAQAQPPRHLRTDDAIEQESTSFGSVLSSAGDSLDKMPEDFPADFETELAETELAETELAETDSTDLEAVFTEPQQESTVDPTIEAAIETPIVDPDAEITTDIDSVITPLVVPIQLHSIQSPSLEIKGSAEEPDSNNPQQPQSQPIDETSQSIQPENSEGSTIVDDEKSSAPEKIDQQEVIQQPIAMAPAHRQGVEPSSSSTDATIDGQAISPDAPTNSETTSGDTQQQTDQQQQAQRSITTPKPAPTAEFSDPNAAQPLRQSGIEPAPIVTDPVSIDPQASHPATSLQGVRPVSPQQATPGHSLGAVEPDQAFNNAVHRGLAAAVRQQGGTLTIKLDPPTLGKLTIRMTIGQGKVEATFEAQTAQARDLLIEHASTLRAQLRDRGLTVERLEIVGATSTGKAGQPPANTGDQPGANDEQDDPHHDAAGGHSRGRSETGEEQSSTNDGATGDTAGTAGEPLTSPFEAQLRYSVSAIA